MSVIAWDGTTLAADKRASSSGIATTTTKIRRVGDSLLGWTGDQDAGEMVAAWFEDGADPAKWPECQKDKDDWSRLIVVDAKGVRVSERQPIFVRVEDKFMAWGSGRDFALAAMHLGRNAVEAVAVASHFSTGCGNGIDWLQLEEGNAQRS